jgi:recombinational DNA repair ATPase RecF
MSSVVRHEFFRWIASLDPSQLNEIDRKLLNLLVDHFDTLEPLTTAKGSRNRASKLNELIQKLHSTLKSEFPDVLINQSANPEKFDRILELKIGPFRGFATTESFAFDKKYTFMYGPNGSGKSSFCEGLEYALLGGIEEASAKRIDLANYIKNTQKGTAISPIAYGVNSDNLKIPIPQNPALYRFAFVEKNRIDGFARIAATTESIQKDRIATLFGLDAFSAFVDGFTDDFEKYITLLNSKEEAFKVEIQKNDSEKIRITQIDAELLENSGKFDALVTEVAQKGVLTRGNLKIFLTGENGVSGFLQDLQKKKIEQIPEDLKFEALDSLPNIISKIRTGLLSFGSDLEELKSLSSDVNFKDLYSAVVAIGSVSGSDLSRCPACKTPIEQVIVNPFKNAKTEVDKLQNLSELQERVQETGISLAQEVRSAISTIKTINEIGKSVEYLGNPFPLLTEFVFSNIPSVNFWKPKLEAELLTMESLAPQIEAVRTSVSINNAALAAKRNQQLTSSGELKKYQDFNTRLIELTANEKKLFEEKATRQKMVECFTTVNAAKIKEIDEEKQKIAINQQYVDAYKKLIKHLKLARIDLPAKLSEGLSEKVKEFYNIVNGHDPNFELLDSLSLPATTGAKIEIKFKGDTRTHDALHILSEGHIKVLGLSILLAKAVHENLGFLIFDDIVNAIDDDHRGGIADLLLCHDELKDRQHILTCHGETFINKLEHKLGISQAGKHVKSYRFNPADAITTRGIQVSIGESKHYLLKAKESLDKNSLKDSAAYCRRAVESNSNQLWKNLDKRLKVNLKVTMRGPGVSPDLATVVDSLIKEVEKISGTENLRKNLSDLKAKYPWSLLNKGVHEDDSQSEFERKDISELIALVQSIEENISSFKLIVEHAEVITKPITAGSGNNEEDKSTTVKG